MSRFYRFEYDPAMAVNLDSDTSILQDRLATVQVKIAQLLTDHEVIVAELTKRAVNDLPEWFNG